MDLPVSMGGTGRKHRISSSLHSHVQQDGVSGRHRMIETTNPATKMQDTKQQCSPAKGTTDDITQESPKSRRISSSMDPQTTLTSPPLVNRSRLRQKSNPRQSLDGELCDWVQSTTASTKAGRISGSALPVRVHSTSPAFDPDQTSPRTSKQEESSQNEGPQTMPDLEEIEAPAAVASTRDNQEPPSLEDLPEISCILHVCGSHSSLSQTFCSLQGSENEDRCQSDASESISDGSQLSSPSSRETLDNIRMKHNIIASLMQDVYAIFDSNWDANIRSHAGSGDHNPTASSVPLSSSSSAAQKSQKRHSQDDEPPSGNDGNGKRTRRSLSTVSTSGFSRLLACPFHKYDPAKYRSTVYLGTRYRTCMTSGFKSICRLK